MKPVIAITLCTLVLFLNAQSVFSQSTAALGAGTQDPRKILAATEAALKNVKTISYEAEFQGVGKSATDIHTTGKVAIAKLPASDPMMARVAAQGTALSAKDEKPYVFHAAFDGKTDYRLRPSERSLTVRHFNIENDPKERKFGSVTGDFGYGAYSLILFEFINFGINQQQSFSALSNRVTVDYEGYVTIADTRCHVIYLDNPDKKAKERWFIGMQDHLPRRYEYISMNDQGRVGITLLTLSNLKVNQPLADDVFTVALPEGYSLKNYEPPVKTPLLAANTAAPDWTLLDAQGQKHSLTDYRGKIVLLDFWATWCGPCVRFMPDLQKLHEEFGPRGLIVLGINTAEEANAESYMKERRYSYGLLLNGETLEKSYHATTIPTVYVIGADGNILHSCVGDCLPAATTIIKQNLAKLPNQ